MVMEKEPQNQPIKRRQYAFKLALINYFGFPGGGPSLLGGPIVFSNS